MQRIYHPYDKWEDYKAGFYDNVLGKNKQDLINKVVELFSNPELTKVYMNKVINDWQYSCEHNLSNYSTNRVAYLGQAACCLYAKIPYFITMNGWNKVELHLRNEADYIANQTILIWEKKHKLKNTLKTGKKEVTQMEFLMKFHTS